MKFLKEMMVWVLVVAIFPFVLLGSIVAIAIATPEERAAWDREANEM